MFLEVSVDDLKDFENGTYFGEAIIIIYMKLLKLMS
jgi:hypothetical protein